MFFCEAGGFGIYKLERTGSFLFESFGEFSQSFDNVCSKFSLLCLDVVGHTFLKFAFVCFEILGFLLCLYPLNVVTICAERKVKP